MGSLEEISETGERVISKNQYNLCIIEYTLCFLNVLLVIPLPYIEYKENEEDKKPKRIPTIESSRYTESLPSYNEPDVWYTNEGVDLNIGNQFSGTIPSAPPLELISNKS